MKKKSGKIWLYIFFGLIGVVAVYASIAGVYAFFLKKQIIEVLTDYRLYLIVAGVVGIVTIVGLIDTRIRGSRRVLKVNVDLENSHFLSMKEVRQNEGYTITRFEELGKVADGVPIYAELKRKRFDIVLREPIHTLVIGSTGTGKTSAFVSPAIEILARTKTKPGLVITDPKGELYAKHADTLKKQGYTVSVIDLADIFHSTRWNPFNDVYRKTERMQTAKIEQLRGKYYVDGKEYLTHTEASKARDAIVAELESEIYVDLQDLIYTMCAVESKNEPGWERGARDFIFAVTLGFWEDVRDGYMPREKFNLFNLYKAITEYATGECEVFKAYVETRDERSRVRGLSNTVLESTDRTLSSYLGEVNKFMTWLADRGITTLTSGNDVEFGDFDVQPNALFLKIPDERENRYKMVTLFVTQMYKALVEKARRNLKEKNVPGSDANTDAKLLRHVYFLLDEFGNMPRVYNLDKIVTVGRSRGIFFVPVIQDFSQLNNKYGKDVADTIRSQCNIQIFIGTNDENTRKAFSELCGKKKVKQVSYSEKDDMSVSTSAQSVPLIYPSELERLNDPANGRFGNMIALVLGNYPMKSKITPYFKAKKAYGEGNATLEPMEFIRFDEKEMYYDVPRAVAFIQEDRSRPDKRQAGEEGGAAVAEPKLAEAEAPETKKKPDVRMLLLQKIGKRIEKLKRWLEPTYFARLSSSELADKLKLTEQLIAETPEPDNFLRWDLAELKCDLQNYLKEAPTGGDR